MKYRDLIAEEIPQKGDEVSFDGGKNWAETGNAGLHQSWGALYRRPIKEDRASILREKIDAIPISGEIKKAVTSLVEELSGEKLAEEKPVFYRVGQRFLRHGEEHILAQTNARKMNLISLKDGNRWTDEIAVKTAYKISKEELFVIVKDGFQLIS